MHKLSVIIPVINEADNIAHVLDQLTKSNVFEMIVVDGGSHDRTLEIVQNYTDKWLQSPNSGRARQMNLGADKAIGDTLLFLHADTILPQGFENLIVNAMSENNKSWGRFDVRLSGKHAMFRLIENMMNLRSRMTGIATGDQAIFVRRSVFENLGGFEEIPLMEDLRLSKSLKKISPPICLSHKVITSSRRWEENGILKTILLMWRLRLAFFLGVSPYKLAKKYH